MSRLIYNGKFIRYTVTAPYVEPVYVLQPDLPSLSSKTIKITGSSGVATCHTTIATNKGWTVTTV